MDTVMRGRVLLIGMIAAMVVAGFVAPATAKKGGATHEPPYKAGPSGGDEFNEITTDPETGHVTVRRVFPGISPVVGCAPEPAAGWATLHLKHHVTSPVKKVTLNFDGTLDPYAWVTAAALDDKGKWLGVAKLQGPHNGAGKIVVKLHEQPKKGSDMTVEFGVQVGDSCPQVGYADATFSSVTLGG